jgi:hypothetical protein
LDVVDLEVVGAVAVGVEAAAPVTDLDGAAGGAVEQAPLGADVGHP